MNAENLCAGDYCVLCKLHGCVALETLEHIGLPFRWRRSAFAGDVVLRFLCASVSLNLGSGNALQASWSSWAACYIQEETEARKGAYAEALFGTNLRVSYMGEICQLSCWVQQKGTGGSRNRGGSALTYAVGRAGELT